MTSQGDESYTFKICGMNKELSLKLSGETAISDILEKLSSFCSIKSSSLQIRNGHESLSDINKKLKEYNIEDPSNFLVLRNDILEQKAKNSNDEETDSKDSEEEDEETDNIMPLQSNAKFPNIKSPIMPSVPNNSFTTEPPKLPQNAAPQGLHSALEALLTSQNGKKLNSLSQTSKKN